MVTTLRKLQAGDLEDAERVFKLAFGAHYGLAGPAEAFGDAAYVKHRFRSEPEWAFAVEVDGAFAGSNFVARWGTVGFFGPLTIDPRLSNQGLGQQLVAEAVKCFHSWGTTLNGLFTFAESGRHVGLYHKFGFWPRYLTAIMTKSVASPPEPATNVIRYSNLSELDRLALLAKVNDCLENNLSWAAFGI